jgi:Ca2+-transporting ATPase
MGQSGTDVAKGAADMILTDDNFATIVRAVAEGRGIYDNIRKAVHFLLSSNVGEILVVFASSVLRLPAPLLPIQLLWVNLVTDSLPALALGTEPPEEDVMRRPPVPAADSFFAGGLGFDIAAEGMLIGAITLLAFIQGNHLGGADVGRTMAFTTLSMGEIGYAVSMRSPKSVWKAGLLRNKRMVWAVLTCALLQGSVLTIPTLSGLFQVSPLGLGGALWTLFFSVLPFTVLELEKRLRRKTSGRRLYGFVSRLPGRRFRDRLRLGLRHRRGSRFGHGLGR